MTIYAHPVKRARIFEEPNISFATDHSGTLGDYLELPFVQDPPCTHEPGSPFIDPGMYHQRIDGHNKKVPLPRFGALGCTLPLATLDARVANGATAPQSALGRLLKILMGGEQLGISRTVAAGATTTVVELDSITGVAIGGTLAFATGTGGRLEARIVADISSTTVTLMHALSNAPATSSIAIAAANYYLYGVDGSLTTSLQAIVEGLAPHGRILYRGGWPTSFGISQLAPGQLPRVSTDWRFAAWDKDATAAASLSGTLGRSVYVNNRVHTVTDSYLMFHPVTAGGAASIGTELLAPVIEFNPNIAYETHMSPSGINTIVQALRVPADQGAGSGSWSFVIPYEDESWETLRDDETDIAISYQIGSSALRGGMLLTSGTCQVTSVTPEAIGKIDGIRVVCEAREDEGVDVTGLTGAALHQAFSPWRLAFF